MATKPTPAPEELDDTSDLLDSEKVLGRGSGDTRDSRSLRGSGDTRDRSPSPGSGDTR